MRGFLVLGMVVGLVGCGGDETGSGEPDRSGYTPEDYLPEGTDLSGYSEPQRICALHTAMSATRLDDCGYEVGALEAVIRQSLESCQSDPSTMAELEATPIVRCLDFRASASCAAIAESADCHLFQNQ